MFEICILILVSDIQLVFQRRRISCWRPSFPTEWAVDDWHSFFTKLCGVIWSAQVGNARIYPFLNTVRVQYRSTQFLGETLTL
jgi:hypothetical protein